MPTSDPEHDAAKHDRAARGADLAIGTRDEGGSTILSLEGELDLYTAPTLRDRVLATMDDGRSRLIIDLDDVPFMDSSGLGVIVACLKRLRESGGDLTLVTRHDSPPGKLLALTGLDRAIPTFSSVDDALTGGR